MVISQKKRGLLTVLNFESKALGFRSRINFIASCLSATLLTVLAHPTQLHVGWQTVFAAKQAQYLRRAVREMRKKFIYNFKHFDLRQLQPRASDSEESLLTG